MIRGGVATKPLMKYTSFGIHSRRQGFLKIHYYYKDGLNVFLKKKSENIVFRLGSGSNKEKTTYLPNKVSNGSGTLKLGFG